MSPSKMNEYQDQRITSLEDKFSKMCDNHAHDIQNIKDSVSGVKVDIAGIIATQKVILTLIVLIFGGLVGLFFKA